MTGGRCPGHTRGMDTFVLEPTSVRPPSPGARGPGLTASIWGAAGMLAAAALAALVALPLRPDSDRDGWAEIGWILMLLIGGAVAVLIAGTACVYVGLRRAGHPRAALTAGVFIPAAVLLGAVSAGVGALAAPAVASWVVTGFARTPTSPAYPPVRPTRSFDGLAQRLLVTLVVCAGVTSYTLQQLGYRLGGEDRGEVLVWALCLPALVVVPVLVLRRSLPVVALAGLVVVMAGITGAAVPAVVESAHPSPERLARLVSDIPMPTGLQTKARADGVVVARVPSAYDEEQPFAVRVVGPAAATGLGVPAELQPDGEGRLWRSPGFVVPRVGAAPASTLGRAAADEWEKLLVSGGWTVDEYSRSGNSSWLPGPAAGFVDAPGRLRYDLGLWVRASVVPYGDGAVLVVSTRP